MEVSPESKEVRGKSTNEDNSSTVDTTVKGISSGSRAADSGPRFLGVSEAMEVVCLGQLSKSLPFSYENPPSALLSYVVPSLSLDIVQDNEVQGTTLKPHALPPSLISSNPIPFVPPLQNLEPYNDPKGVPIVKIPLPYPYPYPSFVLHFFQ